MSPVGHISAVLDDQRYPMRLAVRWCAGVAAACVLWGALSVAMLSRGEGAPTVRVAALQPDYRWAANAHSREDASARSSRRSPINAAAAAQGAAIVWPESRCTPILGRLTWRMLR